MLLCFLMFSQGLSTLHVLFGFVAAIVLYVQSQQIVNLKMNKRNMLAKATTHEATCKYVDVLRASTGIRSKQRGDSKFSLAKLPKTCMIFFG